METVEIRFELERATKNTIRYTEVPEAGQPPRVDTLYITLYGQKWALGTPPPRRLVLTLAEDK